MICLKSATIALTCTALILSIGCKKTADNTLNYKSAINTYYASRPACLWSEEIKFPEQANTDDDTKTKGYDALVDQGVLTRSSAEKKRFLIGSKQVNLYDLSSNGHSAWTADPNQPGYGNFCYGQRKVSSIDSSTPNNGQPGATTVVTYTYSYPDAPAWTKAAEVQAAFPTVQANIAGTKQDTATLTDTSSGWAVTKTADTNIGASPKGATTAADGSMVH